MATYEDDVEPLADPIARDRSSTPSNPNKRSRSDVDESATPNKKQNKEQRDISPEPDETFDVTSSQGTQMWLVKVPNFLLNEWRKVDRQDVELGHVRVFTDENGETKEMELRLPLPPSPAVPSTSSNPTTINIPRIYDMRSTETAVTRSRNLYAFKETFVPDEGDEDEDDDVLDRPNANAAAKGKGKEKVIDGAMLRRKGKRYTELSGKISNEAALKPQMSSASSTAVNASANSNTNPNNRASGSGSLISPEYRELMRKRKEESMRPKKSVILVHDDQDGESNRIASGISGGKNKGWNFTPANRNSSSSQKEKNVRLPLNELHDLIFRAFEQYPYWTSKALRERTKQPENYLKEVLVDIADLQKRGPYANNWSLKESFKKKAVVEVENNGNAVGGDGEGGAKDDDDDDDDDDEDEDFDNFPIN